MTPSIEIKKLCNSISKNNDVQIKAMASSDITNYFARINKVREEHWADYLTRMSPLNINLSFLGKASFNSRFIIDGKEFNFFIYTDSKIVKPITKNNKLVDSVFQIWHKSSSLIVGVQFHPKCQLNWNDDFIELSDWEKTFSSMALNAEEGNGSSLVVRDILKSIASKDEKGLFSNIFRVLD